MAIAGVLSVAAPAQTVPTFQHTFEGHTYNLVGGDPAVGRATEIPVVIVPVALSFGSGVQSTLDATPDVPALLRSPLFTRFSFNGQNPLQYADAMQRAALPHAQDWHTVLVKSDQVRTVHIAVPPSAGYVLKSKKSGRSLAIADIEYVQREIFKQIPKQSGKLVLAISHNTAYYAEGDATICCLWGTHGSDAATGNSFVLASYLAAAPSVVQDRDVQPVTQQLAEFIIDPLHDPLVRQRRGDMPGNQFPRWKRPSGMHPGDQSQCGGDRVATPYFLLEPTDTNHKNNLPYSNPYVVKNGSAEYHVQNVALLGWYLGSEGNTVNTFSFPDSAVLPGPAQPCPASPNPAAGRGPSPGQISLALVPQSRNGHALIGYWTGSRRNGINFALHDISPQWDVIIVAFAVPDHNAPEGTLRFQLPKGIDTDEFKRDLVQLKTRGKKVLISLGGGGQYFTLDLARNIPNFVSSVGAILREYGFDGVDIDFETPSLMLASGDTDFTRPTTPSIVNLIAGLRQLKQQFGASFMISLVPEGPQMPAGHVTYGGQFGSYLPLAYGLRDILSFLDVQDYNTPPLEGLDGEIYQAGAVDYHAAITELVLHGFAVAATPARMFPALPQNRVAVGFLTGETTPEVVVQSLRYLLTGHRPPETTYQLRKSDGYPGMLGAMFWTIDADARESFKFSNAVGPELRRLAAVR